MHRFVRRYVVNSYGIFRFLACQKTEFRCDTGLCIDEWRQCDNNNDCPDKSDEVDCGKVQMILFLPTLRLSYTLVNG